MDVDDSYPHLSEKDILYELFSQRHPVLKDQELEAAYAACKKYTEIAKAANVLRLQFDCATRLGYKDEAVQIALLASAHQQDRASSSHTKDSEKEQRTVASLASSLTEEFQQAAPGQFGIVYLPLDVPMLVAEDMEVEKGEKSIYVCAYNHYQGRSGCDWYRLDLVKKECSKIFGRLEWGGISTTHFGVATVGSIIYALGGVFGDSAFDRLQPDWFFFNDVFYLDVHRPQDGWKEGPQLPSPHFEPVATSMNETIYVFNGKYVFASALDTSDSGSGWKSLAESPILESPSDMHFVRAFPDPTRDRILLLSYNRVFFAYYPRKQELECIDYEFKKHNGRISSVCAIVDGVLYHVEEDSNQLLCAYDLDQRKMLTPVYHVNIAAPYNYFVYPCWDYILDLGGGKLCFFGDQADGNEGVLCLKLKVQKEGGDKVHITVLSFDTFWIVEDIRLWHCVAV